VLVRAAGQKKGACRITPYRRTLRHLLGAKKTATQWVAYAGGMRALPAEEPSRFRIGVKHRLSPAARPDTTSRGHRPAREAVRTAHQLSTIMVPRRRMRGMPLSA